jgi:hypothetical protein
MRICGKLSNVDYVKKPARTIKPNVDLSTGKSVAMPKRNLRIVKRVANIPVLGLCEYCDAQFSADPTGRMVEGQLSVQEEFDAHQCKRLDTSRTQR